MKKKKVSKQKMTLKKVFPKTFNLWIAESVGKEQNAIERQRIEIRASNLEHAERVVERLNTYLKDQYVGVLYETFEKEKSQAAKVPLVSRSELESAIKDFGKRISKPKKRGAK